MFLQNLQARTIDEVIGRNLYRLRDAEDLTLAQTADTLTALTGQSFSEAKLSRWEAGRYRFTVLDLHLLSGVYGVNLLGLLKPDDETTHVRVGDTDHPAESYVYDFFVDPRGSFTTRAFDIAARNKAGTRDIIDALADVQDRLGERGQLGDLHPALLHVRKIFDRLQAARDAIETPEDAADYQELAQQTSDWWDKATEDIERKPNDGIDPETP